MFLSIASLGPEAIEDIKAGFANQPRKANQILALFRILLGYAVKLRLIRDNPALRFLTWLERDHVTLTDLGQADLDRYLAQHPGRGPMLAVFLHWTARTGITRTLHIPGPPARHGCGRGRLVDFEEFLEEKSFARVVVPVEQA